jgi:nitrogen-specific signal transduction histidine kinase
VQVVVAHAPDGAATVEVHDRGDGISDDLMDKVFLPFYPQHRGRPGLGLAVAAKFAHALGGYIELSSDPGAGTTARLVLPAKPPADEA